MNVIVDDDDDDNRSQKKKSLPTDQRMDSRKMQACNKPYRFEDILRKVGDGFRWHFVIFLIAGLPSFFAGLHNVGAVFLLYTPDHWCSPPRADLRLAEANNWTTAMIKQFAIPRTEKGGSSSFSKCEIRIRNYTAAFGTAPSDDWTVQNGTDDVRTCSEWIFDTSQMHSTVVSDWSLVCQYTAYASFGKSCYMIGMFFGSVTYGMLSDRYGRRPIALVCLAQYLAAALLAGLSPSYSFYITFRLLTGMAAIGLFMCTYVVMNETVMPKHRGMLQIVINIFFSLGIMTLPLAATIYDDWKSFYALITVTSFSMLSFYWILPESPRWLILRGRKAEAVRVIRMIANVSGRRDITDERLVKMVSKCYEYQVQVDKVDENREEASILTLFRTPKMRKHTLVCSYLWASVSCAYYGITYASPNLGSSLRMMVLLVGQMDLFSGLAGTLFVKLISRKANVCANIFLTGVFCLSYGFLISEGNGWMENTLIMAGRFTVAVAFAFVYVLTAELFPTDCRNIALGVNSTMSRFGAVGAAFMVDFMSSSYSMILFGIQMMLGAGLCLLLQETGNTKLPETESDVQHFNELEIKAEKNAKETVY